MNTYRLYTDNKYSIPATWTKMTISIGCGRKIDVWQDGPTVVLLRCQYGRNPWDTADCWLDEKGLGQPARGPQRVRAALTALSDRINRQGLTVALQEYRAQGICCCCGASLTDEVSKLRGIGPECIKKIEAQRILAVLLG